MDHQEEVKRSMGGKLQIFLANPDNSGQFTGYTPMTAAKTKLNTILTDWDALIAEEAVELLGPGEASTLKKTAMCNYWGSVAHTAVSWALEFGHTDEAADWNHTANELMHEENNTAAGTCKHLHDTISDHIGEEGLEEHGIDDAVLAAGELLTDAFKATIGNALEHRNEKSAKGVEIEELIKNRFDPHNTYMKGLVNGIYFIDKRSFVTAYNLANHMDELPTHHTIASFHFADAETGDNIKGVNVHDLKSGKGAVSDVMGNAAVSGKGFKGGKNLEFVCEKADYVSQTKIQTVKLGQHVSLEVSMAKV